MYPFDDLFGLKRSLINLDKSFSQDIYKHITGFSDGVDKVIPKPTSIMDSIGIVGSSFDTGVGNIARISGDKDLKLQGLYSIREKKDHNTWLRSLNCIREVFDDTESELKAFRKNLSDNLFTSSGEYLRTIYQSKRILYDRSVHTLLVKGNLIYNFIWKNIRKGKRIAINCLPNSSKILLTFYNSIKYIQDRSYRLKKQFYRKYQIKREKKKRNDNYEADSPAKIKFQRFFKFVAFNA